MSSYSDWLLRFVEPDDVTRLEQVTISASEQRSLTVADLVRAWWEHLEKLEADLLRSREDRSIWGAHDFVATLHIRDMAAKEISRLSPKVRLRLDIAVRELDQRFLAYTEPDHDGCAERVDGRSDPSREWWWKRIPVTGPVREELIRYYGHSSHG